MFYRFMRVRNSSRVFCCVRKHPSIQDVTVIDPGFWTPRMVMHRWLQRMLVELVDIRMTVYLRCLHDYRDTTGFDSLLDGDGDLFR